VSERKPASDAKPKIEPVEGVLVQSCHGLKQAEVTRGLMRRALRVGSNQPGKPLERAEESSGSGTRRVTEGVRGSQIW